MINHTKQSLEIAQKITNDISNMTFHHHYHVLYDIPLPPNPVYLEIGCYAGGSSCLMLQKPDITVIAIDTGVVISQQVVQNHVAKLNTLNNKFYYIEASSQLESTVEQVKKIADSIDLLFIDGDHSYAGVMCDYNLWSKMVKSGGYIVFDDYRDHMYSPEVRGAVDQIVSNTQDYEIIGTLPNIYEARPADLLEGNCFIVRKK